MSRRKEPPRVLGPTQERGGKTWRVVLVVDGKRTSHFAATEAEARRIARRLEHELPSTQSQTVQEMMKLYLSDRVATGHTLPTTAEDYRRRIVLFFGADLDREVSAITPARAAVLYQCAIERELPKSNGKVSTATQRIELTIVKMLFGWAGARRHLEVPDCLQAYLRSAAAGRPADDFLFGASRVGGSRSRQVLHRRVVALCKAVGVMRVCPHSLRGLWATLQARSGADPNAIARSLAHGSFEVTRRHYAQASALHGAQTERVAAILGNKYQAVPHASQNLATLVAGLSTEARQELMTLLQSPAAQSIRIPPAAPNSGSFSTKN